MDRLAAKFTELKVRRKKAFIAFITAGFPALKVTESLVYALEKAGADIIELGVPFSDPLADGPVIQNASYVSLKGGTTLNKILDLVRKIRRNSQIPICLMSYYNPILAMGVDKFVRKAVECGVDGIIPPDLPPEEAGELISLSNRRGLKTIFFLAPTSSNARIKYVSGVSSGFIYYVSSTGVTGERAGVKFDLKRRIDHIKRYSRVPVCVGFGVSNPKQVREISVCADGVIVGSAIVKKISEQADNPRLAVNLGRFVKRLASGTDKI